MKIKKSILCFLFVAVLSSVSFAGVCVRNKPQPDGADCFADIDLTSMNPSMAFSVLKGILNVPTEFAGKTVKIRGQARRYRSGNYIELNDSAMCCSLSVGYVLADSASYPDEGKTVCVRGTFSVGDVTEISDGVLL